MSRKLAKRPLPYQLVEPNYLTHPEYVVTYGPEVAEIASLAGYDPDPEQQLALDVLFAIGPDGSPLVFEFGIIAPRQNLKTGFILMAELGWLYVTEERLIVHSAHELSTTAMAFRDLKGLIEDTPALSARLHPDRGKTPGFFEGNGRWSIELATGQQVTYKARTAGGGRGLSAPKVVLDEGFALQDAHVGSLFPTVAAMPDPQIVTASSAGKKESAVLRDMRDRGRAKSSPAQAYLEWGDPDPGGCRDGEDCLHAKDAVGCAADDLERLARANPAYHRRILPSTLLALRQSMTPSEFVREFLGWWDDPTKQGQAIFGAGGWHACAVDEDFEDFEPPPPAAIGVAASIDQGYGSIGAAGRGTDGRLHLGGVDRRRGTTWMIGEAKRIQDLHDCAVVVDEKGPAADLIEPLETAGVRVTRAKLVDYLDACASLFRAVQEKTVTHAHTDELDAAVAGAAWRTVGDRRAFGRKSSTSDVAMLEAVTLAAWGSEKTEAFNIW